MAANKTVRENRQLSIPPVAIVIALLAAAGLALFVYLQFARPPQQGAPVLTGDARAYVKSLKLMDVQMDAHESYLKQAIVEITGKIGNEGDRVLKRVEINCVFYDAYGQLVLRERVPIVREKMGTLAPGEIKPFRLDFDNIPESRNQAMPQMVIAQILFQ